MPPPTREDILLELGDPDQVARVAAVPLVGSLGPPAALGILSGVFAEEDDPLARSRAVAALTRFEGLGAGRQDAELRMQALNALAHSSGERSINVLAQGLRQDREPEVRMSAGRRHWARHSLERAARLRLRDRPGRRAGARRLAAGTVSAARRVPLRTA